AGRADDQAGMTWLLVGERTLVTIDMQKSSVARHPLQVGDAACWGLARLADGSLWTLKGRSSAIRISESGEVLEEVPLGSPHFGVFAAGDRLVVQPADSQPPAPLLFAARIGGPARMPWSSLRSRSFNLARASVAALNMLICGVGRREERPCWVPDAQAPAMVNAGGGRGGLLPRQRGPGGGEGGGRREADRARRPRGGGARGAAHVGQPRS